MKSTIKSAEIYQPVGLTHIQKSVYDGFWSGNIVRVIIKGVQYRLKSSQTIRGMNVPCKVIVTDDLVEVEI